MAETRSTPPPERLQLVAETVDVWQADLADAVAVGDGHELLSAAERERAARFRQPQDGRRWAAARGILRALLSAYAGLAPDALRLVEGAHGKPALDGSTVRFNLSHSGDVALYAFALEREVGVDVELPRRAVDHVAIARRVLGDAEAERLAALDPPAREREFLRAWVRWEALLKCRGTGIGGAGALPLAPPGGPEPWVCELDVEPPGAAALAVAEGPCAVRLRRWPAAAA